MKILYGEFVCSVMKKFYLVQFKCFQTHFIRAEQSSYIKFVKKPYLFQKGIKKMVGKKSINKDFYAFI